MPCSRDSKARRKSPISAPSRGRPSYRRIASPHHFTNLFYLTCRRRLGNLLAWMAARARQLGRVKLADRLLSRGLHCSRDNYRGLNEVGHLHLAWLELARSKKKRGHAKEAERIFRQALRHFPGNGSSGETSKSPEKDWSALVDRLPAKAFPENRSQAVRNALSYAPREIEISDSLPSWANRRWIKLLEGYFCRPHYHQVLRHILQRGHFLLPAPDGKSAIFCLASVYGPDSSWIAYLFCDDGHPFWLFVRFTNKIVGILFPAHNMACAIPSMVPQVFDQDEVRELHRLGHGALARHGFASRHPPPLTAFVFSRRPYHFVADHLAGLLWARHNHLLARYQAIQQVPGRGFCDLSRILREQMASPNLAIIGGSSEETDTIALHPNVNPFMSQAPDYGFFETITSLLTSRERIRHYREKFAPFFPVVWFGVTSQKRAWREQSEGYRELVEFLRGRFANPLIVVDGWTGQMQDSDAEAEAVAMDTAVYRELLQYSRDKAQSISLIGARVEEKAAVARNLDSFIANMGTGCLLPSLNAKCPGIVHSSQALYNNHSRHNLRVGNLVAIVGRDISDGKFTSKAQTSYSIAPRMIIRALAALLDLAPGDRGGTAKAGGQAGRDNRARENEPEPAAD